LNCTIPGVDVTALKSESVVPAGGRPQYWYSS